MWSYFCYDEGTLGGLWQAWFEAQNQRTKARHEAVFTILEQRTVWSSPYYKKLKNADGIGEIRISTEVPHRIFGYHDGMTFNIMIIGSHKGNIYSPRDAIKTARNRMREVEEGVVQLVGCKRPRDAP